MKRLMIVEGMKLLPNRSVHVLLGLYAIMLLGVSILAKEAVGQFMIRGGVRLDLFRLPDLWRYLHVIAAYLNVLLGTLVISLVCNEWEYLTLRQHVADGLSRFAVVMSKTLLVAGLSGFAAGFVFVVGAALGQWPQVVSSDLMWAIGTDVGRFWLQTFGYLSLAMLASIIMQRVSLATAFFVSYIWVLEPLSGLLLERWIPGLAFYLPVAVLSGIVESPFGTLFGASPPVGFSMLLFALGYCLVFHWLCYGVVARSDL